MPTVHEPGMMRSVTVTGSGTFAHDPPILDLERHLTSPTRVVPYERELDLGITWIPGGSTDFLPNAISHHWNGGTTIHTIMRHWAVARFANYTSIIGSASHPVKYADNGDGTWDVWLEILFDIYLVGQLLDGGIIGLFESPPLHYAHRETFESAHITVPTSTSGFSPYPFEMSESEVLSGLNGLMYRPSEGLFTFQYTSQLFKYTDGTNSWEASRLIEFEMEGSFTPRFTFLTIDETFLIEHSFSRSYIPGLVPAALTNVVPRKWFIEFEGLGPNFTQDASYAFSDLTLENQSGTEIDCSTDNLRLLGLPQQGQFYYTGSDFQADTVFAPNDPDDEDIRYTILETPSAIIRCSPSWNALIEASFVDYEDASLINPHLVHETRHVHTGGTIIETEEWDALQVGGALESLLIPPGGGYLDSLEASILSEGRCYDPSYDSDPGTPGIQLEYYYFFAPETTVGHDQDGTVYRPWALLDTEYEIPVGETHVETLHSFYIKDSWANAAGLYTKSYNRILKYLALGISQRFNAGTLAVVANKVFTLFDTAANWVVPHTSAFYLTNADISGLGVATQVGGTTRFTHGVGGARALWRHTGIFKPFAHRYYQIPYLAEGAGETYRFGLGRLPFGAESKYYYRYAWEWTSPGSGSQMVTIDLMHPTHKASVSGLGVITVDPTTEQVHPSSLAEGVDKASTAWFEMITTGQIDIDYIEGFLETGGTRTPALLYHGMQVSGSQVAMANYEPGSIPASNPYFLIYSPNGVSGFGMVGGGSISSVWGTIRTLLSNGVSGNDTGFTVALPTHVFSAFDFRGNHDFEHFLAGSFGEEMTAGVAVQVHNRLRIIGKLIAGVQFFYGMGATGSGIYGSTLILQSAHLLRGEARLVVPDPVAGHQATFHNNPSGTVLYTGLADDDGAIRAFLDYGVPKPRSNSGADFSSDDPVEYSGVSSPYTYTAQGELLNSYWAKPIGWAAEVDAGGYFTSSGEVRADVTILDGWPNWLQFVVTPTTLEGIDIAHSPGGVHVTLRVGNEIRVRNSYNRGFSWSTVVVATSDEDAIPTIYWDPEEDRLWIWFHTSTEAVGYSSKDQGATWTQNAEFGTGAKWPRACHTQEGQVVAFWRADAIEVHRAVFDGVDGYELETTVADAEEQVPELHLDIWNRLSLLWQHSGGICRITKEGTWQPVATITTGELPIAAQKPGGGLVMVYNPSGDLVGHSLEADMLTLTGDSFTLPDLPADTQYVGLSFDSFGVAWLVVKLSDETSYIQWSNDRGVNWQTL